MAAQNQGIPVPPLTTTERIEDWQPLFTAAVGPLLAQGEGGVKILVSMLPAFVCRNLEEKDVAKEAVLGKDTLEVAFYLLKKRLDPPVDEFEAVKEFLSQNGLALDIGLRSFVKVANLRDEPAEKQFNNLDDPDVSQENTGVNALRLKPRQTRNWRGMRRASSQLECYRCHERGHEWKFCPKRVCDICGGKAHDLVNCSSERRDSVKGVGEPADHCNENAVTSEVSANGVKLHEMLDTGAKPSVLDRRTLQKIGRSASELTERGHVFGLCSVPIVVLGCVNVTVDIGDQQVVTSRFKVIDTDERIFILGRDFMSNFDSVEFDWDNCKVCFGGFWKASVASYKGGTPWDRSIVAECSNQADNTSEIHYDINPKLDGERREGLARLLCEFVDVFVLDPKKPTRTNLGKHLIDTNGAQPVKQPLRRMPPI
ncbi:hypothetical protein LOD99_12144 [Oopsacas minuta]|uniref:CCHC-type domain-containing protein n=1 Tax=Oopsacas minuta TaxID=111878 RepID=A0AAV7JIR9_9METZ|nr:hypothetical protein LOD99_12144 [Oopsacas minuta]